MLHLTLKAVFSLRIAAVLAALLVPFNSHAQSRPHRFESAVLAYEAADKTNPPPRQAILLVAAYFF